MSPSPFDKHLKNLFWNQKAEACVTDEDKLAFCRDYMKHNDPTYAKYLENGRKFNAPVHPVWGNPAPPLQQPAAETFYVDVSTYTGHNIRSAKGHVLYYQVEMSDLEKLRSFGRGRDEEQYVERYLRAKIHDEFRESVEKHIKYEFYKDMMTNSTRMSAKLGVFDLG